MQCREYDASNTGFHEANHQSSFESGICAKGEELLGISQNRTHMQVILTGIDSKDMDAAFQSTGTY